MGSQHSYLENLNQRIYNLLKDVRTEQDHYRAEALRIFIEQTLNRIKRVSAIHHNVLIEELGKVVDAESLQIKFLEQLEAFFKDALKKNAFVKYPFKTIKEESRIINYEDFKDYMCNEISLVNKKGDLSNLEEYNVCDSSIKIRLENLIKKHNAYIQSPLSEYTTKKLSVLDKLLLDSDLETEIDVKNEFVERLEKFSFVNAYVRTSYENKTDKFEINKEPGHEYEIKYKSFDKIVSKEISFTNTKEFISSLSNIGEEKKALLHSIILIENEIENYSGDNKKAYKAEFIAKMSAIKNDIHTKTFFSVKKIKSEIEQSLEKIEEKENEYYTKGKWYLSYFNIFRENSTLKPKIEKAKEIFEMKFGNKV